MFDALFDEFAKNPYAVVTRRAKEQVTRGRVLSQYLRENGLAPYVIDSTSHTATLYCGIRDSYVFADVMEEGGGMCVVFKGTTSLPEKAEK